MADPQILTTLRRKQDEIETVIAVYEAKIEDAKRDQFAVNATLRIFELNGEPSQFPVYADTKRLWRRGEIGKVCREALTAERLLDTRELALRVIRSRGLDEQESAETVGRAADRSYAADGGKARDDRRRREEERREDLVRAKLSVPRRKTSIPAH